jgi:hypothetical protein
MEQDRDKQLTIAEQTFILLKEQCRYRKEEVCNFYGARELDYGVLLCKYEGCPLMFGKTC